MALPWNCRNPRNSGMCWRREKAKICWAYSVGKLPNLGIADNPNKQWSANERNQNTNGKFRRASNNATDGIGSDEQNPARQSGQWQQPPMIRAADKTQQVRNNQSHKGNGTSKGGRGAAQHDCT